VKKNYLTFLFFQKKDGFRNVKSLRSYTPVFLVLPAFLTLLVINIFPFIFSLFSSFTALDLKTFKMEGFKFVGLENYVKYTFADATFRESVLVTLEFTALAVAVQLAAGLYIALLLNQDVRGIGVARSLIMIPMAISPLAVGYIFKIETQQEIGIIAYILREYLNILFLPLTDAFQALSMLVLVDAWMWTPFVALVLLAGLRTIPVDLVEVARVDGASSLQIFRHITLPSIRFQIIVVLLIRTMDTFKIFDIVYILTGGAPGTSTQVASYWIYKVGMKFLEIGKASAMTYIMLIMVIIISTVYIKYVLRRE